VTSLRLALQVLSIELRRAMTYRFEFWFRFLGVLFANVAIAYYLWKAIFAQTGAAEIQGYTFPAMVLYYVLVPLTQNITRSHEASFISNEIYTGTLTRYLVFPMSFFVYKYASTLANALIGLIQLGVVLALYAFFAGIPPELHLTPASVATGVAAALLASVLNFYVVSCLEMIAFWADNIWSLNVMLMFMIRLCGGAMLPLALFPEFIQRVLPWTPFPYLISFPILTLMGRVAPAEWAAGMGTVCVWILAFAAVQQIVWKRGSLHYSGVGI
jgi:ABC-2 type transport system permease protein